MTHFKQLLFSTLIIGAAACSAKTPSGASQAPQFDGAAMDALLSGAVERGEVIGVQALVFDDGQTVYRKSFSQNMPRKAARSR